MYVCVCMYVCMYVCISYLKICLQNEKWVTQLSLTLWNPVDSTVHGILQDRILDWVAFPFSRGSSQPKDQTQVSHIAGRFFTSWATTKAQEHWSW